MTGGPIQDQLEAAKKALIANGFPVGIPPAVREMAEKGLLGYRESYDRMSGMAEQANATLARSCATAQKNLNEYNASLLDALHTNVAAAFDYCNALTRAKTFAEVVEVSSSHVRSQLEAVSAQAKNLSALAQKTGLESLQSAGKTAGKAPGTPG